MDIYPADNSYRTFCDLIGGYRMFSVIRAAISSGIIDLLDAVEANLEELLAASALKPKEGRRFVELLVNMGLIEKSGNKLALSSFSKSYLSQASPTSQRQTIEFELILMKNWERLEEVLHDGQGALIRDQSYKEYHQRLNLFQQAMGEAAAVRSRELWDAVNRLPEQGTIVDIGAGDTTYLRQFLARHPGWHAVACDLPDVCKRAASSPLPEGLVLYPCNILDSEDLSRLVDRYRSKADLLLFSNILHCYGTAENRKLLNQTGALLTADGLLVIHDFFSNANPFGALYDLHMLVNTFNGRCYTTTETIGLLNATGLNLQKIIELPSGSLAVVATVR